MKVCTHGRIVVASYTATIPTGHRIVACRCCNQALSIVSENDVETEEYCDSCRQPAPLGINISDSTTTREAM